MREIISFICTFICLNGFSQVNLAKDKNEYSNKDSYLIAVESVEKANQSFRFRNFQEALFHYLKLLPTENSNPELIYHLGICYFETNKLDDSQKYFTECADFSSSYKEESIYQLARILQRKMHFEEAIKKYNEFDKGEIVKNSEDWRKDLEKRLIECQSGIELYADTSSLKNTPPLSLPLNTNSSEYRPVLSDSGILYFSGIRQMNEGLREVVLHSNYSDTGYSNTDKVLFNNKVMKNTALVNISEDGTHYLFYDGIKGLGDLYYIENISGVFGKKEYFPSSINSSYSETSACFSASKDTIFFISYNPKGSFGQSDIYYSIHEKNNKWSKPINLGDVINTKYAEEGILYDSKTSTLYFSSKGHNSIGGYDIFRSVYDRMNSSWSKPENLSQMVNSPYDDLFFSISSDRKKAFFTSSRIDSKGKENIYQIDFHVIDNYSIPIVADVVDSITDTISEHTEIANIEPIEPIDTIVNSIYNGKYTVEIQIEGYFDEKVVTIFPDSPTDKWEIIVPKEEQYKIVIN